MLDLPRAGHRHRHGDIRRRNRTLHVADLYITGDTAWMSVVEGFVLVFHDGGTPGSEIVGPENAAGLFPTKDWYEQAFFIGTQHFTGFVTTGNIKVFSLPA